MSDRNATQVHKCMHCRRRSVVPTVIEDYTTVVILDGVRHRLEIQDFALLQCSNCKEMVFDDEASDRFFQHVDALRLKLIVGAEVATS